MTSTQKAIWGAAAFILAAMIVMPPSVWSDTVGGLNTFGAGETARASEVNQNFTAIADAVDGNDGLISALDARVAAVEATDPVPGPQGDPGPQGVQGPAGGDAASFELVGFTSATFAGDQGVFGFTAACQLEFANSRMCTSVEAMNTVNLPQGLAGEAWIRPVFVPISQGTSNIRTTDASGVFAREPNHFACGGWSFPSERGLRVDAHGRFQVISCGVTIAVACCRNVAVP